MVALTLTEQGRFLLIRRLAISGAREVAGSGGINRERVIIDRIGNSFY
jgi:hypothetical protein